MSELVIPKQPFASPGDALEHVGVKGMKWGVRKAKRPSTSDIRNARARQSSRENDINRQADKLNLSSGKKADNLAKGLAKDLNNYATNKDAAVAARMTKGEKAASILIGGPIGLIVIGANSKHVKNLEKIQKK